MQCRADDATWVRPGSCLSVLAVILFWRGVDTVFSPVNGCVISVDDKLGYEDCGMLVPSLDGSMMIPLLTWFVD